MTHLLQRTALIALATGALGACSTVDSDAMRPNFPTRTPDESAPVPAAAAPVAPTPAPPAPADTPATTSPAAPVTQTVLAPLPPITTAPAAAPPPPPPAVSPPPPAPIATYRSVTTRSVTGKVVDVEGAAQTYRVKKGDSLGDAADALGVTVRRLRSDNGLSSRARIKPGQVLKGARSSAKAYVAEPGDTLFAIARRFGVTAAALRDANDLPEGAGVRSGQRIKLPSGYRDQGPLVTSARVRVDAGAASPPPAALTEEAPPEPATPRAAAGGSEPVYRNVTTKSVTGKVVDVEAPGTTYRVKKGDTLTSIARKLDTTVDQLRDDNDLKKREKLQPGDMLKGPPTTAKAYVVGAGDTLFAVGRRFGVTADALRDENDLGRNASLRNGQRLRLPDGARDRGPVTTTARVLVTPAAPPPAYTPPPPPPPRPSATYTPAPYTPPPPPPPSYTPSYPPPAPPAPPPTRTPPPYSPAPYTPPVSTAPPSPPSASDAQVATLGRGRFVWPLQGDIVSDFGAKPTGQRNDGINISATVGASVRAAAAGDVVYAGDQVPGFGNLVLIKHADGWVTAYGHLSRVLVKMQQKVTQGQEIGLAGATGGVAEPQLHFEIRYASSPLERAKPIDPKLVLPTP